MTLSEAISLVAVSAERGPVRAGGARQANKALEIVRRAVFDGRATVEGPGPVAEAVRSGGWWLER